MQISDFSTTPYPTHRPLRHFPRRAPSHGPDHSTLIIIIAVSASVAGLLLTFLIWRVISRLLRPKSAPLPPRQSLVYQRELELAAFAEYKDASVPDLHLPSPHFFNSCTPASGSSSSLPSSNDDSAPSSDAATPPTRFSTSPSPSPSSRRPINRLGPQQRPMSMLSTSSRQSIRAAPHAPHSNVQIVLPTPLAPSVYEGTASDGPLLQSPLSTYSVRDNWRRSLADSWILVGQDCLPDSEPMGRQYGHDRTERPTRLMRRGSSPGPLPLRSRSNPSSLSRLRPYSGLDQLPEGAHPPVPRIPSEFGTLSGHRALAPSTPSRKRGSLTP